MAQETLDVGFIYQVSAESLCDPRTVRKALLNQQGIKPLTKQRVLAAVARLKAKGVTGGPHG